MSLLATIDVLHAELDKFPGAHNTRLILADALEEAGGEWAKMAAGYRALAVNRLHAIRVQATALSSGTWSYYMHDPTYRSPHWPNGLPSDWSEKVGRGHVHPTRRLADDFIALMFAALPASRQAELLNPTVTV